MTGASDVLQSAPESVSMERTDSAARRTQPTGTSVSIASPAADATAVMTRFGFSLHGDQRARGRYLLGMSAAMRSNFDPQRNTLDLSMESGVLIPRLTVIPAEVTSHVGARVVVFPRAGDAEQNPLTRGEVYNPSSPEAPRWSAWDPAKGRAQPSDRVSIGTRRTSRLSGR